MSSTKKDKTTFKEAPFLVIKGFLMGSADIVPGVSGGTLALILGIYERLLNAIKSVNTPFLKALFKFRIKEALQEVHLRFLGFLLIGVFSAFAFFTKVVPLQEYMFTDPEAVYGLFFGLILGSIYILIKEIESFRWQEGVMLLAGIAFGVWIVNLVPADTPENPAFVFLSGCIAITAMILPGISGSYLLLIMRKYDFILMQLGKIGGPQTLDGLIAITPFVLGALVGITLFSRFLSWLLSKYNALTIAVLIGFLIGSLFVIWPYQHRDFVESVRDVEELSVTDPIVIELLKNGANSNLPEYYKLVDENLGADALTTLKTVKVERVKRKLLSSKPYVPGYFGETPKDEPKVWEGIIGMIVGIIMVGGLDKLRDKT
ncbi:MAG: DUF368 domain-containing protein [Balneolaceae bacterium]